MSVISTLKKVTSMALRTAHLSSPKTEGAWCVGNFTYKWNFTKFLVGRDGEVIKRYALFTKPKDIEKDIMRALIDSNSSAFRSKI